MVKNMHLDMSEFYEFNELIEKSSSIDEVLNVLIMTVNKLIPDTDMTLAYLYDSDQKVLRLGAGVGVSKSNLEKIAFQPGESLTGKVFLTKEALACSNRKDVTKMMSNISRENMKWYQQGTYKRIVKSSINVPLMDKKDCIGTFTLNRYNSAMPFSTDDIKLLHILTSQAARMINYIGISESLEESHIKEHFLKILFNNGSRKEILNLLENNLKSKFFLECSSIKPIDSISIIRNQNLLGHLTSEKPMNEFSRKQFKIIHYAVDALSILLSENLDNYEKKLRDRSECFNRILNGENSESLSKYLHIKNDEPVYCFAISAASYENMDFARYLENLADRYFQEVVLFFINSYYIILSKSRNNLNDFAEYLHSKYALNTGVGNHRPIRQIDISYKEAIIAAKQNSPFLIEYSSIGHRRLWYYLDNQVKYEFVQDQIGPLLELSTDYLSTLGALIENGRTFKSKTAEQLFIHTNTLYQRLRKIESVLGISLQNEHQWMNIMIAYEMYVELYIDSK